MKRTTATVALIAGLACAGMTAAQDRGIQTATMLPEGAVSGLEALQLVDTEFGLAAFAEEYNLLPHELANMLRNDRSMYVLPDGSMVALCPLAPLSSQDATSNAPFFSRMDIPLDDFMNLESNPGADKTIYMDVDGHFSSGNSWGHSINFPAYNTSGSSNSFSDSEKQEIIDHWLEVVEDFKQFDVNVTTKDPGINALRKSGGSDQEYGIRCLMTQPTSGFGNGIGGVAFLNSFDDSIDNPCFAFNKGLGAGPMTVSHEVGHTLGLSHDGLNGDSYHPGSSGGAPSWGPIMGAPFNRELVQWSIGDYPGATTGQNDLAIFQNFSNGLNLYPDDHPDGPTGGTPISANSPVTGVIDDDSDTDAFTFTIASDSDVIIDITNFDRGPNLDVKFDLFKDSPFSFVAIEDTQNTADASATYSLSAGTYTIVVDGTYQTKTRGPVSDYGSLGEFTVNYTVVSPVVISYPGGVPTELDEGVQTEYTINIDPGSYALDTSELYILYGVNFATPIFRADLVNAGGNNWTATLPAADCDDEVVFALYVNTIDGQTIIDPSDINNPYSATVVCDTDCVADTNGDGNLDGSDFTAWINAFNNDLPECDQNDDGTCTPADFTAWINNYNAGC